MELFPLEVPIPVIELSQVHKMSLSKQFEFEEVVHASHCPKFTFTLINVCGFVEIFKLLCSPDEHCNLYNLFQFRNVRENFPFPNLDKHSKA
jgi:hypothetical protein